MKEELTEVEAKAIQDNLGRSLLTSGGIKILREDLFKDAFGGRCFVWQSLPNQI